MKENNKLKVVHTTWEEFLKEHPVNEVVDMPSLPNGYVARVVTVNAVKVCKLIVIHRKER